MLNQARQPNAISDILSPPPTINELRELRLSTNTIKRVFYLLAVEQKGDLTTLEKFQLDSFKEAVWFLRKGQPVA